MNAHHLQQYSSAVMSGGYTMCPGCTNCASHSMSNYCQLLREGGGYMPSGYPSNLQSTSGFVNQASGYGNNGTYQASIPTAGSIQFLSSVPNIYGHSIPTSLACVPQTGSHIGQPSVASTSASASYSGYPQQQYYTVASHQMPSSVPVAEKQIPTDKQWEIPRQSIMPIRYVGSGNFGQVWKCEVANSGIVAVKTFKDATEKEKTDLLKDLAVMKLLEPHPNVITLLGCCTEEDPICVIMEFISGGNLLDYLRDPKKHLTSGDLELFCYQVAKGMKYLASKKIIHKDLAARNVLVDNKVCKVADFGFARDVSESDMYKKQTKDPEPFRWMAPESIFYKIYSTKSDVWSFGILMWEIFTLGKTPYPGLSPEEVMRSICTGYRLGKPDYCHSNMYTIMLRCWQEDPEKRASFSDLVKE